jgi:hypothetical protein
MRWAVALLGAAALLAAGGLGLRPRLKRPVLRLGVVLREAHPEDEAVAAGVALALEERDHRGGRFLIKVQPVSAQANGGAYGSLGAPLTVPGLHRLPPLWTDADGGFLTPASLAGEVEALLAWARRRGLSRLVLPGHRRSVFSVSVPLDNSNNSYAELGLRARAKNILWAKAAASCLQPLEPWAPKHLRFWPGEEADLVRAARPDLVFLEDLGDTDPLKIVDGLRAGGFEGPIVLSARTLEAFLDAGRPAFDGCLVALAPVKPSPPDFLRRLPAEAGPFAHPFAYPGYRAALRLLDALDANPKADPASRLSSSRPVFEDLCDAPAVYELRNGRVHLLPPDP